MSTDGPSLLSQRLQQDPGLPTTLPTESYWQKPPHQTLESIQSATFPTESDIVIIGSGITGCSVARELLKSDDSVKVIVLEARTITSGATGRNGGHISCSAVQDYAQLANVLGKEAAAKIVAFRLAHYDAMLEVVNELGGDALDTTEIRKVDSVTGLLDEEKVAEAENALRLFENDNPQWKGEWKVVGKEEARDTYNFGGVAGVLIGPSGAAWPYRLVTAIFEDLLKKYDGRFSIETFAPVSSVTKSSDTHYPYSLNTIRGTVKTKQVVYCINGHTGSILSLLRGKIFPSRGHMSVQVPGSLFPRLDGTRSWNVTWGAHGLDYISQNPKSNEIFIGGGFVLGKDGGANDLGNADDSQFDPLTQTHLHGALPVFFGSENWGVDCSTEPRVKAEWTGIMGFTADGLPLVGKLPKSATNLDGDGEWIAAGFNGYGMVNCWLSGKALANKMLGKDVDDWFPQAYEVTSERVERICSEIFVKDMFES